MKTFLLASLILTNLTFGADVDVAAAKADYERKERDAVTAQEHVNTQQGIVNQTEQRYFDALSDEKVARDTLEREQNLLTQIENELPALQNQVNQINARISQLKSQKQTLESELASLEPQLSPLQNKLSDLQNQLNAVQAKLDAENAKVAPLQAEIKSLEQQRANAQKQVTDTENLIINKQKQIDNTKNEIASLQQAINEEKAKQGPDQNKINNLENKKNSLKNEISSLQNKISQLNAEVTQLKNQENEKTAAIAQEKQKLGPTQNKITQLEGQIQNQTERINQIKKRITQLQGEIAKDKDEAAKLTSNIEKEKAKPNPDKQKINQWENQLKKKQDDIERAEKQIAELQKDLTDAQAKLSATQSELAAAKASVQPILDKIAQLENEKKQISSQLAAKNNEISTLNNQIQGKNGEIASVQKEIDTEKAKQGPNQAKIDQWESKKTQLNSQLGTLGNELSQAQASLPALKAKLSEIDSKLASTKAQLAPLQANIDKLNNQAQDLRNQIASVKNSINDLTGKINTKKNQINDTVNQFNKANNDLQFVNSQIANHPQRVEAQRRVVRDARENLRRKTELVNDWSRELDKQKNNLSFYQQQLSMAIAARDQAYSYLQEVIANYEREKARIIELATNTGNSDGLREAQDRANTAGRVAGADSARRIGYAQGSSEAQIRDERKGYRDGRQMASTDPDLLASYQNGIGRGMGIARNKAASEAFPQGYNEALTSLLSLPPSQNLTLDITSEIPEDPGQGGTELSNQGKPVIPVVNPQFPLPLDPPYLVPVVDSPIVNVPLRDNRYFNPPCNGLQLVEFESLCRSYYDQYYGSGYASNYETYYRNAYREAFDLNIQSAYDIGLSETFATAFAAGRQNGALDQGILDGFQSELPKVVPVQKQAGKKALNDALATGNLVLVRSASLVETSGDGLFTPGETVKLNLVIDNYGKFSSLLKKLTVRVKDKKGLETFNFEVRELPSLAAETRTTLVGTLSAQIAQAVAGDKVKVIVQVETDTGALVSKVQDEKEVHFPLELTAITLAKDPKVDESVGATLKFKNLTSKVSEATPLKLSTNPNIVTVESTNLAVGAISPGAETQIAVKLKPGVWVGENTFTNFISQTTVQGKAASQVFKKKIRMNRFGSLLLFDGFGEELADSTLSVQAGKKAVFQVQVKANSVNSTGRISFKSTSTSDPTLKPSANSTTGVDYGFLNANYTGNKVRLSYDVPEALKGKKAWVMVQLSEGTTAIHALQVFLDVK